MGAPAAAQALTACCYLTDEQQLLYVLDFQGSDAIVEDARTCKVSRIKSTKFDGWRVVTPGDGDG